ncbi:MAG: YkgJ family cysteine cluster protein [Deltaproteobacteria bacterium]|nr:YkgJ family cysteine cluster protein [Deltaproteobacteria bacterium]
MGENNKQPAFACRQCGECCCGDKGILVTPSEAEALAAFLRLTLEELQSRFLIDSPLGPQLATLNGACVFLADNRCRVHPVKPRICREWPFLPALLKHADEFEAAKEACPGLAQGCSHEEFRLLGKAGGHTIA